MRVGSLIPSPVLVHVMVLDFQKKVVLPENVRVGVRHPPGVLVLIRQQRLRNVPAQARRQRDEPFRVLRQQVQIDARLVIEPLEVPRRDQLDEVPIPLLVLAQQNHVVVPVRIRPRLVPLLRNVHLAADHRMHARRLGRVIELDRAEQVPVIGHGHGRHLLLERGLHELVDIASPIQQGVVGMAMQVDKRHGRIGSSQAAGHTAILTGGRCR
jgi:hypothetical protein